jgi:CHAT domain-containing protein/Flp pilus assembly protein TadD
MLPGARAYLLLLAAGCGMAIAQSDTAHSLLIDATALYNESHYPEAIEQLQRAEGLARQNNDIELLLQIKELEGNALRTLGRVDESLRDYQEWFQLNKQLPHPLPEGRATRFLSLLYREMGDVDKSETIARQALKLARAEGNLPLQAGCLLSIGALYKDRLRYREAIVWHNQALVLAEHEKLSRLQAEILNSLADAEQHLGHLEQAESHFGRAMDLATATGYLGLEAQVTARRGEVDMARGRYQDAIDLFARATALNHQIGDPLTKVFVVDLDWAEAERAAGHPEEALKHYRDAIAEVERLEMLTVPNELARSLPVAISRQAYEEAADVLVELNRPEEALEVADSGRARAFVNLLNESHIDAGSSLTDEQRSREEELKRQVAAHRSEPAELAKALGELEDYYLGLRRSNPAYAQLRRPSLASAQEVQRELVDADTAFVEYLLGTSRSHAWIVTSQAVQAVALPPRERVDRLLESYRKRISQPVTRLTPEYLKRQEHQQARELYRLLIEPLAPYFKGSKRLLIVPDGAMANVPFESLIDSQGHYLLEKHAVVYSQSASASLMLRAMAREMPPPESSLLAFGDPVSDISGLAPIPYTREEATAIAGLFPSDRRELLLGAAASESALKREDLTHFGYLHFAVHGLVDDHEPARSGLALAHQAGSAEDGILRSEEIARLRLNAQLVVLSGCRTADGKLLAGEGLLTISRSFHYAGARAVVATLWNVDDISTTELMKGFYAQLRNGRTPEDALQQAKIQMARGNQTSWTNPWFWSPFIIFQ